MRRRRIRLRVRGLMVLVAIAAAGFAIVAHRQRAREQEDRLAQIAHHRRAAGWYRRELKHRAWYEGHEEVIRLLERSAAWHDERSRRLRRGGPLERPNPSYAPGHNLALRWYGFRYNSTTGLRWLLEKSYGNACRLIAAALQSGRGLGLDEAELLELSEGLKVATRGDQFTQHRHHAMMDRWFLGGREWSEGRPDIIRLAEKVMAWHEAEALRIEHGGRLDDPGRGFDDDPDHARLMHWQKFLSCKDWGLKHLREGRYDLARTSLAQALSYAEGLDVDGPQLRECSEGVAEAIQRAEMGH